MHGVANLALTGIILASSLGALLMCLIVVKYGLRSGEDDPGEGDETRRLLITRLGHAGAGVCFAVSALLAVVALVQARAKEPSGMARAPVAGEREVAQLGQQLLVLEQRLADAESRATAADQRLDAVRAQAEAAEARATALEATARQAGTDAGQALVAIKQLERTASSQPQRAPAVSVRRAPAADNAPRTSTPPRPFPPAAPAGPASSIPAAPTPTTNATRPAADARTADERPEPGALPRTEPPPPSPTPRVETPRQPVHDPAASTVAGPGPGSAPSTPARTPKTEGDLATKVRQDWESVKRDVKNSGDDFKRAVRRFVDWLTP